MGAAEVLLARLKEKDYRKWVEVIALAPPELVGNKPVPANSSVMQLGAHIKTLIDAGLVRIAMGADGVVRGRPPKKTTL